MKLQDNGNQSTPPNVSSGDRLDGGDSDRATRLRCLAEALEAHGMRLAVAESCTGGLLAANLTTQAGSSTWFEGGWVTYSNAAKQRELAVPSRLFAEVGAVSAEVVAAMAAGAVRQAGTEYGVGISGVAGPGGGSDSKPVGTVWLGWAFQPPAAPNGAASAPMETFTARYRFGGDRQAIREASVDVALRGLCAHLSGHGWSGAQAAEWSSAYWPVAGLKL
ncbi:CinA family protein [Guyparkeria sp. 1SP6A2]|nr:CinA family protein [Guyparkeria sp. 1SP6A2]